MPARLLSTALSAGTAMVMVSLCAAPGSAAGSIEATILDREGAHVPEVVVYAIPRAATATERSTTNAVAKMDQRGLAFVPHILVVQTGTLIEFPNSDDVLHHVYSFSPAKRFELPLYAGTVHKPLKFDEAGLVTLGCNIHDDMLGYIQVVDTPYFGMTGSTGKVLLDGLPDGDYEVHAWTPRQRPQLMPAPTVVSVGAKVQSVLFQFEEKLYPPHKDSQTSLLWSDY